jgi:AraC-like DNA-binding protein
MRAIKENVLCTTDSFIAYEFEGDNFNHPYHFHNEIEIVLIEKSSGKLVIGDHISTFKKGDIYLFGPNLPHAFFCNSRSYAAKSLVIQFEQNCFGEAFFALPEFKAVRALLESTPLGIQVTHSNESFQERIRQICNSEGISAIIFLIKLLSDLSDGEGVETVLEKSFSKDYSIEEHRLNSAIHWIDNHFSESIQLSEVAHLTNMSEHAFCRAFKKATNKTFLQYLNDIRVHEAAHLLIESHRSITDIAYEVGFTNISSFNRYFKKTKNISPSDFRKKLNQLKPIA